MPDIKEIRSAAAERSNIMVTAHAIYLITAYHPDPMKWEPDFRTRRREAT